MPTTLKKYKKEQEKCNAEKKIKYEIISVFKLTNKNQVTTGIFLFLFFS